MPPLSPEDVLQLEALFREDPAGTLAVVRRSLAAPVSEAEFLRLLAEARQAVEQPRQAAAQVRARRAFIEALCPPPAGIPTYDDIRVNPCSLRFDPVGDALGWAINCGPYWIRQKLGWLELAPFRRHSAARPFVYAMKDRAGAALAAGDTVTVALFSDFGTGEYHSRYIARALERLAPHYAIHLGDVYYSGTRREFREHLEAPLASLLERSRLFALNANHEMLSGGHGYFEYLDRQRQPAPGRVEQEQEASYFCLRGPRYQIVAIDTAYDYRHDGQYRDAELQRWLAGLLAEGKASDPPRVNILLSQHEPYGLGERRPTALLEQIAGCAVRDGRWMVDFWFWGDEHYCALFEPNERAAFVGSCIGHAGHPVDLRRVRQAAARTDAFARPAWVDTTPRFPTIREDELGNAGFCVLDLGPDAVRVTYRDWLDRELHPPFTFPV